MGKKKQLMRQRRKLRSFLNRMSIIDFFGQYLVKKGNYNRNLIFHEIRLQIQLSWSEVKSGTFLQCARDTLSATCAGINLAGEIRVKNL